MENVPQVIANCKILAKLGQGGMGAVFRAVHLTLGRHIALKILPAEFTRNPEYVSRFLREARSIANLNHQNIVLGKAGRSRWLGRRPKVRGTAMNPVDHPHGGGEGKTKGGRHPVTPWGQPTKGYRTRRNKRTSVFILKRRK